MPDKCSNATEKITLVEDGALLLNDEDVTECFNTYFVNITETLDIDRAPCRIISDPSLHPVHLAVLRYSENPSIIRIKERFNETNKFAFQAFECSEVWDEINHLNATKTTSGDIPTQIIEMTSDLSFNKVASIANSMVQSCTFPDALKPADLSPGFKNGISTTKKNYRPISVLLSSLSKVFERLLKSKWCCSWNQSSPISFVDLERDTADTAPNMLFLRLSKQVVGLSISLLYVEWS